jgi:hypothetical protein
LDVGTTTPKHKYPLASNSPRADGCSATLLGRGAERLGNVQQRNVGRPYATEHARGTPKARVPLHKMILCRVTGLHEHRPMTDSFWDLF